MNLNRSSKLLTLLLACSLLLSAVAPAAAVTAKADGAPETKQVGEEVTTTFTLTDLYTDYEKWTLNGQTNLTKVTWTVTTFDQAGNRIAQKSYDGRSFNHSIDVSKDVNKVKVKLAGTVGEVQNFSYAEEGQQTLLASFSQVRKGGSSEEIKDWQFRPYTEESQQARKAIEKAQAAIEKASSNGAGVSEAKSFVDNAISAYNAENFDNAVDLANKATESANSAQQSSQQTQMLLYGGVGLLALVVVVGGVLWYRSQQDSYDKLR